MRRASGLLLGAALAVAGNAACAWGNEGHQVVATVAQHYLTSKTLAAVNALLAQDDSPLTAHDLANEATWADAYRASSSAAYAATHLWHFADIEVQGGSLQQACFGFPPLPPGTLASAGPANDCHVDKIRESLAELGPDSTQPVAEQVLALKYVLHLVGDLHQPLHSADDHDAGGNLKQVSTQRLGTGNLHAFWDSQFVAAHGTDFSTFAKALTQAVTKTNFQTWYGGTPPDWSQEAHALAVSTAYGQLPKPGPQGVYALPAAYVSAAEAVVGMQLSRAGIRLAYLLNQTFDPAGVVPDIPSRTRARAARADTVPSPAFIAADLRFHGEGQRDR